MTDQFKVDKPHHNNFDFVSKSTHFYVGGILALFYVRSELEPISTMHGIQHAPNACHILFILSPRTVDDLVEADISFELVYGS